MKLLLTLLSISFFTITQLQAQIPTDGLVGYWPFNGSASDESGQNRHGTIVGEPTLTTDRFGINDGAYDFDGVDDHIKIDNPFYDYSNNQITVSFWLNVPSFEGFSYSTPIGQAVYNSPNWSTTVFGFHALGSLLSNDSEKMMFWVDRAPTTTASYAQLKKVIPGPPVNRWVHVLGTCDGIDAKLYLDGTLTGSALFNADLTISPQSSIIIGSDPRAIGSYRMKGKIDDVRIYNKTLTTDEILALANEAPNFCAWECANGKDMYYSLGNVGIKTSDTRGYELAVNGKILSEGVKVLLNENWPDYVFEKDYKLTPLKETEKFISDNKHLPGIPSATEVKNEGINLGEMDALLLQKIEELTLHLIEQNRQNEEQKKIIQTLQDEMLLLKEKVNSK